ncbi:MAG: hypothetical protein ACI9GW_002392 [Halieaceae bacterium]|jgi:hypothetical protein
MTNNLLRIGGASGFWGDAARATPQLLSGEDLAFIVYDYLAEITMSIMARARAKDASKGYALDFVTAAMLPNLKEISRQKVRIISNAGGVNPQACAQALRELIAEQGLELSVACISGDDLMDRGDSLSGQGITEMFSEESFPDTAKIQSINAYLGAFPIARALDLGADIVITGRCVDSAVTLGACIHAFGWQPQDLNFLAMGSLAGHILECGPQATGGNFTDWEQVKGMEDIGYPIAEIDSDGVFTCTKPANTGGLVTTGTVAEQMLYEIGDPQAYILPDVVCDFSTVTLVQTDTDRVRVIGATGKSAPDTYKVSVTYADQFRGGTYMTFYGVDAAKKARALGEAIFKASRNTFKAHGLADFSETSIEMIGAESQFGAFSAVKNCREVAMKIAAKHPEAIGIGIMLKEAVGLGLATPPGLSGFQGGRPRPSPVVRLFSFALDKSTVAVTIDNGGELILCEKTPCAAFDSLQIVRPLWPSSQDSGDLIEVPLIKLAIGRSGDKGDKANIGIIARQPNYLPYIVDALTTELVIERFAHFLETPDKDSVERFLLPGSLAINFLLHKVLGGGGIASLRNDNQGKGYAQLLLTCPIPVPVSIAESLL